MPCEGLNKTRSQLEIQRSCAKFLLFLFFIMFMTEYSLKTGHELLTFKQEQLDLSNISEYDNHTALMYPVCSEHVYLSSGFQCYQQDPCRSQFLTCVDVPMEGMLMADGLILTITDYLQDNTGRDW